ncbi:LuxR C-terminal-related transcriptional regulator [Methylobacterium crusticola]|uniref:LuxR C-terminal-related transcriptional regulator n=1 Tax=Methylobacterium crusticola TaxID=1697972 RepID=UPI001396A070|nr:response regulator transcription factor [Methylobacterium crusticola]
MQKGIQVLLAGDQNLILEALECLLSRHDDMHVVGRGTSRCDVMHLVATAPCDLFLYDSSLSETTATDFLQFVRQEGLPIPVVVVSAFSTHHSIHRALVAGARGYVLKRASSRTLVHAIRSVHAGGVYLDADLGETLAGALGAVGLGAAAAGAMADRPLAPREEEVLRFIALGFTAKEIADRLGINERSVETYKRRASEKLGVRTRAEIVEYGMMKGWFKLFES